MSYSVTFILCMYNEVERAPKAFQELQESLAGRSEQVEILLIDNGSTDGTRDWLDSLNIPNVQVILNSHNMGKGGSIKKGIRASQGEYIVIHDPDLEYKAEDIWPLLEKVKQQDAGMGLGSRLLAGKVRYQYLINYWGVVFLSQCINFLYGAQLTDTATALKILHGPLARKIKWECHGFDLDFELVVRILQHGQHIVEVPIQYVPRSVEEGKKIRPIDGWYALKAILQYRFFYEKGFIRSLFQFRKKERNGSTAVVNNNRKRKCPKSTP